MDTVTDFLISGFKHFKATKVNAYEWKVTHRQSSYSVGKIISFENAKGSPDHWRINFDTISYNWEHLLDLAGLIKSISKFEVPKTKTPLDDRLSLYQIMKDSWDQVLCDHTAVHSGVMREGYSHFKSGTKFFVSYRLKDGDIEEMDFYRTSSFIGKLSIKIVRMELNFIKKLTNA